MHCVESQFNHTYPERLNIRKYATLQIVTIYTSINEEVCFSFTKLKLTDVIELR